MAIETLYATSHLAGNCATPANAVGTPDGTFTTNTGNTSWTSRWAIGDPVDPLTLNIQTITIDARRSSTGNGTPSWIMNLYENGSLIAQIGSGTVSTTGTVQLTGTFLGNVITNRSNIEIEFQVTGNGGGPNANTLQIDSITFTADTAVSGQVGNGDSFHSWGFASSSTGSKVGINDTSSVWGFASSSTLQKIATTSVVYSWGFSTTSTGAGEGPQVGNGDISVTWGISLDTTFTKVGESDTTLSWGSIESITFERISFNDVSYSWGFSSVAEGSPSGTPQAVTDLVAVTGGAAGEVVLTWSAPV